MKPLKLTIHTDASLSQVREVREVTRMKVPYRTADAVLDMLADLDLENMNEYKVLALVLRNKHHLTTVVRATFGLAEEELECIDLMELGGLAREIIRFVLDKMAELGLDAGGTDPNAQEQAQAPA